MADRFEKTVTLLRCALVVVVALAFIIVLAYGRCTPGGRG